MYRNTVVPQLTKQFSYKSAMQVPRIVKITLNMGVGETVADKKIIDHAVQDMTRISGQKPVVAQGDFELQDPRELPNRLQGHPAPRAHVRVL
jgi:ribosomal protein L5